MPKRVLCPGDKLPFQEIFDADTVFPEGFTSAFHQLDTPGL